MSQSITLNATQKNRISSDNAVAVVGADIDPMLAKTLGEGDKVLVEVNGIRLYSHNPCPLVAEKPWIILFNNPPTPYSQPTAAHRLVLKHEDVVQPLELHYQNLLHGSPAVFREDCPKGRSMLVALQLVSHYMNEDDVESTWEPHDPDAMRLVLEDEDMRRLVLEKWQGMLSHGSFRKVGWKHKSINRLALRAGQGSIKPCDLVKIIRGQGEDLGYDALCRIHEAIHWLPAFLSQSALAPEDRDTVRDR